MKRVTRFLAQKDATWILVWMSLTQEEYHVGSRPSLRPTRPGWIRTMTPPVIPQ